MILFRMLAFGSRSRRISKSGRRRKRRIRRRGDSTVVVLKDVLILSKLCACLVFRHLECESLLMLSNVYLFFSWETEEITIPMYFHITYDGENGRQYTCGINGGNCEYITSETHYRLH